MSRNLRLKPEVTAQHKGQTSSSTIVHPTVIVAAEKATAVSPKTENSTTKGTELWTKNLDKSGPRISLSVHIEIQLASQSYSTLPKNGVGKRYSEVEYCTPPTMSEYPPI